MAGVGSNTFNRSPLFTLQFLTMKTALLLGGNGFHSQLAEVKASNPTNLIHGFPLNQPIFIFPLLIIFL